MSLHPSLAFPKTSRACLRANRCTPPASESPYCWRIIQELAERKSAGREWGVCTLSPGETVAEEGASLRGVSYSGREKSLLKTPAQHREQGGWGKDPSPPPTSLAHYCLEPPPPKYCTAAPVYGSSCHNITSPKTSKTIREHACGFIQPCVCVCVFGNTMHSALELCVCLCVYMYLKEGGGGEGDFMMNMEALFSHAYLHREPSAPCQCITCSSEPSPRQQGVALVVVGIRRGYGFDGRGRWSGVGGGGL